MGTWKPEFAPGFTTEKIGPQSRAWALEIDTAWLETMESVKDAVIYLGVEALDRVKRKTPVDTGHAQNNWIVSIGVPDTADTQTTAPVQPKSEDGSPVAKVMETDSYASRNSSMLAGYPSDSFPSIYLQNNLPYALALEYGHSSDAPAGMVAMTTAELEIIMQNLDPETVMSMKA